MILYKEKGLKTIPTGYNNFISLYNAILYYYKENNMNNTIHFINRLDKDTEGLLIVAKDKYSANILSKQLDKIDKYYLAIVEGNTNDNGIINLPISKSDNMKREVNDSGKESITQYKKISNIGPNTLLELKLHSGRCHQIRVHLSHIGNPILGDPIYGSGNDLHLCSYHLSFINPFNNEPIDIIKYPEWYKGE